MSQYQIDVVYFVKESSSESDSQSNQNNCNIKKQLFKQLRFIKQDQIQLHMQEVHIGRLVIRNTNLQQIQLTNPQKHIIIKQLFSFFLSNLIISNTPLIRPNISNKRRRNGIEVQINLKPFNYVDFFLNENEISGQAFEMIYPFLHQKFIQKNIISDNLVRNFISLVFFIITQIRHFSAFNSPHPQKIINVQQALDLLYQRGQKYKSLFQDNQIKRKIQIFQQEAESTLPNNVQNGQNNMFSLLRNILLRNQNICWPFIAIQLKIHPSINLMNENIDKSLKLSSLLWLQLPQEQKRYLKKIGLFPKQFDQETIFENPSITNFYIKQIMVVSNLFTYMVLGLDFQLLLKSENIFDFSNKEALYQGEQKQYQYQLNKIVINLNKFEKLKQFIPHFLRKERQQSLHLYQTAFK